MPISTGPSLGRYYMLSLCERTGVSGCVIYNRHGQGRNTGSHQILCRFSYCFQFNMRVGLGFPGGASGKEPACQCRRYETWVRSLGQEDPLE